VSVILGFFAIIAVLIGLYAIAMVFLVVLAVIEKLRNPGKPSSAARALAQHVDERAHGHTNAALICPHCQTRGRVRTRSVQEKKGISGGKATGALLTGGTSVLITGLSRKERLTRAQCENCQSVWTF
jgi:hypothetical protein